MQSLTIVPQTRDDVAYETLRDSLQVQAQPLFTTDVTGLFDVFLANLPDEHRQHYTCHACRKFVETYGGLVTIDERGVARSAIWSTDVPDFFAVAVDAMLLKINKANVTGVFLADKAVWGTPVTGEWTHFAIKQAPVYRHSLKTPFQAMAEKAEDYKILARSLHEFSLVTIDTAITLLQTESLYRSEKCLGVAEWFQKVHRAVVGIKNVKTKHNLTWRAVAEAPPGWCHIRSTMIGTLLEDIQAGMSFDAVSRRFAEKMHPLQYQRPQAAPTVGNIAQAEKLVEKLGIANSLKRRFARLEDIQALWTPTVRQAARAGDGVFSHLNPKQAQPNVIVPPAQTMTWEKFQRTVLPNAERIEFWVAPGNSNYSALLTAVDPDAPLILQWDNPVSWYVYHRGSRPDDWGLMIGQYCNVTAVCLQPSMWSGNRSHQGESVFFLLSGAKDNRYKHSGVGLFPEILKSELREVRATIEAYSRHAELEGFEEASACGIRLQKGEGWDHKFRVTAGPSVLEYRLDRWD